MAPSEIDVFSGPHSRMKQLVHLYSRKLAEVDVSSCSDLRALLWSLRSTFTEFKTHEHIENECIMWRLKNRLQFLKVEIEAVSEVHSDNKLSEMLELVEDGCSRTERCTCPKEAATIGTNIINALHKFTKDFLPHMQEEEEIFQPLLMEYFSYTELKEIKTDVIEKHQKLTKYCPEEKEGNDLRWTGREEDNARLEEEAEDDACDNEAVVDEEEEDDMALCKVHGLPAEVLLQIFSHLTPRDLVECSMVCGRWVTLARDPALWQYLYPSRWARGQWSYGASIPLPVGDESDGNYDCSDVYVVVDDDADFDESASSTLESDASNASIVSYRAECIRREARMLVAMIRQLLPLIGEGVETVDLSKSKGVTNGLVYKLLVQCPNLQHLNLSETKVSDIGFKGLGKSGVGCRLRHLDLSGCSNITDLTLKRLTSIRHERESHHLLGSQPKDISSCSHTADEAKCSLANDKNGKPIYTRSHQRTEGQCGCQRSQCHSEKRNYTTRTLNRGMETAPRTKGCLHGSQNGSSCHGNHSAAASGDCREEGVLARRLEFLSLSGCYRITDEGLRFLYESGSWPRLTYLDLSGCLGVGGAGLSELAQACPTLDHETFFYCDNILEGPFADTASGCRNLQCNNRVCCRSGE